MPLKLVSFCVLWHSSRKEPHQLPSQLDRSKTKEGYRGHAACLAEAGRERHRTSLPCGLLSRLGTQSRDQSFPLGLAWVPHSQDHPRSTCQETLKHTKPHYWEACRQIINLLGTIKAFSYFWLQMLVTNTCTQTSFFSPSSFSPGPLFQETNFLPLGIPGRSGDGTGGREEYRPVKSNINWIISFKDKAQASIIMGS